MSCGCCLFLVALCCRCYCPYADIVHLLQAKNAVKKVEKKVVGATKVAKKVRAQQVPNIVVPDTQYLTVVLNRTHMLTNVLVSRCRRSFYVIKEQRCLWLWSLLPL